MKSTIVYKFHAPTKYDLHPYGTLWSVTLDDNIINQYIQVSQDEANPKWLMVAAFLEAIFKHKLEEESFLFECLDTYSKNNPS